MITFHVFMKSDWTIEQITAIQEIIQRMGWQMDDVPDDTGGYPVNLPIADARMWFIIADSIDLMEGEVE